MARQIGVRLSDDLEQTVRDFRDNLHLKSESDVVTTFLTAAQKMPFETVVDFLYKGTANPTSRVRVEGYIPGGEADEIRPLDDTLTRAPDKITLRPDMYALIVVGNSMAALNGKSIQDGMFALFDPQKPRDNGCIAHVEFEEDGLCKCTVKKVLFKDGGEWVDLKPTNPDPRYKVRTMRTEDVVFKGVLVTAWRPG
ncbi:MAG TPA: S24 family peptidase [Abditibacteriaceae bacterium]|jgi:SOS-response transcriptional repressor LexA